MEENVPAAKGGALRKGKSQTLGSSGTRIADKAIFVLFGMNAADQGEWVGSEARSGTNHPDFPTPRTAGVIVYLLVDKADQCGFAQYFARHSADLRTPTPN